VRIFLGGFRIVAGLLTLAQARLELEQAYFWLGEYRKYGDIPTRAMVYACILPFWAFAGGFVLVAGIKQIRSKA
jgi:hypothetical protein